MLHKRKSTHHDICNMEHLFSSLEMSTEPDGLFLVLKNNMNCFFLHEFQLSSEFLWASVHSSIKVYHLHRNESIIKMSVLLHRNICAVLQCDWLLWYCVVIHASISHKWLNIDYSLYCYGTLLIGKHVGYMYSSRMKWTESNSSLDPVACTYRASFVRYSPQEHFQNKPCLHFYPDDKTDISFCAQHCV